MKTEIEKLLAGYPVVVQQAVVWGEMDSYRHVNNVVYFRYFENVRLEYFRRMNWPEYESKTGVGPILQSTQARFRRPLAYPDTISIGCKVSVVGEDRLTLDYCVVSHSLGDVAASGQGIIVTYHYAHGKKVPVPEELRRRVAAIEGV